MSLAPVGGRSLLGPARTVEGPSGRLAVYEQPGKGLPLVLVHGVNMRAAVWTEVASALPDRHIVALDLRGHGSSSHAGPFAVDDYVADVRAVVATMRIGRAQLAGVSLGGVIACLIAQESPESVQSIVAFGSALSGAHPDLEGGMRRLREVGVSAYFGASFRHEATRADPYAERLVSFAVAERDDVDVIEAVTRAGFSTDLSDRIVRSGRPVHVVNGEFDRTCTPTAGRALAAASGGEWMLVPGAGHILPLENPALCARLISAAATETSAPADPV